jgi:hypothetical protein
MPRIVYPGRVSGARGDGANGRNGEWAMRRMGVRTIATKWLNKIAQGFSPGFDNECGCALKGRPNKNSGVPHCLRAIQNLKVRVATEHTPRPNNLSVALSGRIF